MGKNCIIVKFHGSDLVICSHYRVIIERENLSYR